MLTCVDHPPTINLFNLHAGVKADIRRVGLPKFYMAFEEFLQVFEELGFNLTYLQRKERAVKEAFKNVHECYNKEVSKVQRAWV